MLRIFYSLPLPFVAWPALIFSVNTGFYVAFGQGADFSDALTDFQNVQNSVLAIVGLFLAVLALRQLKFRIVPWTTRVQPLGDGQPSWIATRKLQDFLAGPFPGLLAGAAVLVRLIGFLVFPLDFEPKHYANDTILMFIMIYLLVVGFAILALVHTAASRGVAVYHHFEIRSSFYDLSAPSALVATTIALYLAIYTGAVLFWGKSTSNLDLALAVSVLLAIAAALIFLVAPLGIKRGIAKSKKYAVDRIRTQISELHQKMPESQASETLPEPTTLLAITSLAEAAAAVEATNEWMFDPESLIGYLGSVVMTPLSYLVEALVLNSFGAIAI